MQANLNMGSNIIYNVKNDVNNDGVVNKGYTDTANTNLQNKIDQNLVNVSKEFIEIEGLIDLKCDKSYVDNNIKNVNTKQ